MMLKIIYIIAALIILSSAWNARAEEASDEVIKTAVTFITCAVDMTTDADILENLKAYSDIERTKISTKVFIVYYLAVKEFKKCGVDITQLPTAAGVTLMAMFSEELQSQMRYGSIGR